ncbi:MAG: hypothetical protein ACKPFD_14370 [Dolichospermum sp.]
MSNQNVPSDLVVDLSVEEQQLLSGGHGYHGHHGHHGYHGHHGGHRYHGHHGDYRGYRDRYWW